MSMVITTDDKEILDDLLHSAKDELQKNHAYLARLEMEIERAEMNPQWRVRNGTRASGPVHAVRLPMSTGAFREASETTEKNLMKTGPSRMLISDTDMGSLKQLLAAARRFLTKNHQHLQSLEENLTRALVLTRDQMPRDVITMNAQIRVHELDIGRQTVYTLVRPGQADVARNRISVLAPIGSALLGRRVGDLIECTVPPVTKRVKVKEIVHQAETVQLAA
jgi:regulator of nucleoside diphosphate kinase